MPNDKKRSWRVTDWGTSSGIRGFLLRLLGGESRASVLEHQLNELEDDGYRVVEINTQHGIVIARWDEQRSFSNPSLGEVFALPSDPPSTTETSVAPEQKTADIDVDVEPPTTPDVPAAQGPVMLKGKYTMQLLMSLQYIARASEQGDPWAEARLAKLVGEFLQIVPREEMILSISDIQAVESAHASTHADRYETCSTNAFMAKVRTKFQAYLDAHPVS